MTERGLVAAGRPHCHDGLEFTLPDLPKYAFGESAVIKLFQVWDEGLRLCRQTDIELY